MRQVSETGFSQGRRPRDRVAEGVVRLVARDKHVPVGMLLHRSRGRARVAATRQLAMYLTHVMLGRTLTDVGELFGRDRTTVSYACALVEDKRDLRRFDEDVCRLEQKIEHLVGGEHGAH